MRRLANAFLMILVLLVFTPESRAATRITRDGNLLRLNGEPARLVAYGCYGILTETAFDYETFFDLLADTYGINFVRIWLNYHWTNDLTPFPGGPGTFDVESQSDTYYERLDAIARYAESKGIVIQATFFDSVMLEGGATSGNRWINCPYRAANNTQSYCTTPGCVDDVGTTIWTASHVPFMTRVVETLGERDNIIYEIANEPYPGYFGAAFHTAAIDTLYSLLQAPEVTGSKLIATNDGSLDHRSNSKVDVISFHVDPSRANDFGSYAKPVIISNDGDTSQVSDRYGFGSLSNSERVSRITQYANNAFSDGSPLGHTHLEILDKDIHGSSWLSQDYQPRVGNVTQVIMQALSAHPVGGSDCSPGVEIIIDDQDGAPGFTTTGDDWATWQTAGQGFSAEDTSYHYLSETVGGSDRKGTATWTPDLPEAGLYAIATWFRMTHNRTTDANHFVTDAVGNTTQIDLNQRTSLDDGEASGWVTLGEHYCGAGTGGCTVMLDGRDDNQSDAANAMRFSLVQCGGSTSPPSPECNGLTPGEHVITRYATTAFAESTGGETWENAMLATGERDGQSAHTPNLDAGEALRLGGWDFCNPEGGEEITNVSIACYARTQYDAGDYDILVQLSAGGAASINWHQTSFGWVTLSVTSDHASWTWEDVNDLVVSLALSSHPNGHRDSDVWVDACRVSVTVDVPEIVATDGGPGGHDGGGTDGSANGDPGGQSDGGARDGGADIDNRGDSDPANQPIPQDLSGGCDCSGQLPPPLWVSLLLPLGTWVRRRSRQSSNAMQ